MRRCGRRHGLARAGVLLLLAAVLTDLALQGALAHAVLIESAPADGARLDRSPDVVTLVFDEPVSPILVRVLDAAGEVIAGGAVEARGTMLRLALPPHLPRGSYLVSYRVTSLDGHPVAGSLAFGIGPGAAPPAGTGQTMTASGWWPALVLNRALTDAALLATAGGALFVLLVLGGWEVPEARRLRFWLLAGAALAALGALLGVGLAGGALGDLPGTALLGSEPWRLGFGSSTGDAALGVLLGLLLLTAGFLSASQFHLWTGAVVAVLSLVLTGHAATAPPRGLATLALAAHLLAVTWWMGALGPLLLVLRRPPAAAAPLVRRFSRLAVPVVVLLLIAGLGLAILQVRTPEALVATRYGNLLALKLVVVALLLGLAILNRLRLTPALERGELRASRRLQHSIAAEIACALVILAATAALTQTPPPRALPPQGVVHAVIAERGRVLQLEITPGRAGLNTIVAVFENARGEPLEAREVVLSLSLPAANIEPLTRPMTPTSPGRWRYEGGELSLPGRWRLRLDALVGDFDKAIFETEVEIR